MHMLIRRESPGPEDEQDNSYIRVYHADPYAPDKN